MRSRVQAAEARKNQFEMAGCTFQPDRQTVKSKTSRRVEIPREDYVPIHERQALEIARRENKIKALKEQVEQERLSECTFSPGIRNSTLTPSAGSKSNALGGLPRMSKRPKLTINVEQAIDVSMRLYADAQRNEAKRALLAQSVHTMEMNEGRVMETVERHLVAWDLSGNALKLSPRLSELHDKGRDAVARKLSQAKNSQRRHSLVLRKEEEDMREATFSPRISRFARNLDALMLLGRSEAYRDTNPFVSSPRYIRLYDTDKKWRIRAAEARREADDQIDSAANTAFSAACSPTFQKQRKQFCDPESTVQLYLNHARIQERKERLYFWLNNLARDKQNINFKAVNIPRLDVELRESRFDSAKGTVSPDLLISPRPRDVQEHNLEVLHDRHERKNAAQQDARDMHAEEKRNRSRTVFAASTMSKTDRKLHLQAPNIRRIGDRFLGSLPSYDFIKSRAIFARGKPKHDTKRMLDPVTKQPVEKTGLPGPVAPAPRFVGDGIKAVVSKPPSSSLTKQTASSARRVRGKSEPRPQSPPGFSPYAKPITPKGSGSKPQQSPSAAAAAKARSKDAPPSPGGNQVSSQRSDVPTETFITSAAEAVVLAAKAIADVLSAPDAMSAVPAQNVQHDLPIAQPVADSVSASASSQPKDEIPAPPPTANPSSSSLSQSMPCPAPQVPQSQSSLQVQGQSQALVPDNAAVDTPLCKDGQSVGGSTATTDSESTIEERDSTSDDSGDEQKEDVSARLARLESKLADHQAVFSPKSSDDELNTSSVEYEYIYVSASEEEEEDVEEETSNKQILKQAIMATQGNGGTEEEEEEEKSEEEETQSLTLSALPKPKQTASKYVAISEETDSDEMPDLVEIPINHPLSPKKQGSKNHALPNSSSKLASKNMNQHSAKEDDLSSLGSLDFDDLSFADEDGEALLEMLA